MLTTGERMGGGQVVAVVAVPVAGGQEEVHRLLECYMYLKVYQVWGTERMSELQGQEEVWNHLQELWIVVRGNHSLESISV